MAAGDWQESNEVRHHLKRLEGGYNGSEDFGPRVLRERRRFAEHNVDSLGSLPRIPGGPCQRFPKVKSDYGPFFEGLVFEQ